MGCGANKHSWHKRVSRKMMDMIQIFCEYDFYKLLEDFI
jgi:hypothetical protein